MAKRDPLDAAAILTPAGLGQGEDYFLVGESTDPVFQKVRALLEWASPKARCVGAGGDTPPFGATVVLFQPNSLSLAADMLATGKTVAGRVRFLPIPSDYPWAFWDVWGCYEDRPDLLGLLTSLEAYRHFFRGCQYLGGERYAAKIHHWNSLVTEGFYWENSRAYLREHDQDYARVERFG
jgi:hypothetical protein